MRFHKWVGDSRASRAVNVTSRKVGAASRVRSSTSRSATYASRVATDSSRAAPDASREPAALSRGRRHRSGAASERPSRPATVAKDGADAAEPRSGSRVGPSTASVWRVRGVGAGRRFGAAGSRRRQRPSSSRPPACCFTLSLTDRATHPPQRPLADRLRPDPPAPRHSQNRARPSLPFAAPCLPRSVPRRRSPQAPAPTRKHLPTSPCSCVLATVGPQGRSVAQTGNNRFGRPQTPALRRPRSPPLRPTSRARPGRCTCTAEPGFRICVGQVPGLVNQG